MRWDGSRSPWELRARPGATGPTASLQGTGGPSPEPSCPCRAGRGATGTGTVAIPATWGDLAAATPAAGGCSRTCRQWDTQGWDPPVTQSYSIIF